MHPPPRSVKRVFRNFNTIIGRRCQGAPARGGFPPRPEEVQWTKRARGALAPPRRETNTKEEPMPEKIAKVAYFTVNVADQPGEAACILASLAQEKVNLLAFSGFPRGAGSQLDFVPANAAAFVKAARRAGLRMDRKKEGFLVQGDDKRGAVAGVLERLAEEGINVTAIDAVSAGGGRYGAILWVKPRSVARAARALGKK